MKAKMDIIELATDADKVIKLYKSMADTFDKQYIDEHVKLAIMAGLRDAYNKGYADGYSTGANGFKKD